MSLPVKNYALYIWRVFAKWLSFFLFGLGTLVLAGVVLPLMRLFLGTRRRFQKYARILVSAAFRLFVQVMGLLGVVTVETDSPRAFRSLQGKILAANHPSLLDVVILIALIPNADCIVNGALLYNIVRGIIKLLYIPNSLPFDEIASRCAETLAQGNCLIVFPEGTRTLRSGPVRPLKGAARLSILTGRPLVPALIGGNDKWGLGKKDPWTAFNHSGPYLYELSLLREISPAPYAGLPYQIGVKRLNEELKTVLYRPLFTPQGREVL